MKRHELPDTGQNTRGPAQLQIGAPNINPTALKRHAAGANNRIGKAFLYDLLKQDVLQPRGADEEYFKGSFTAHTPA